MQEINQEESQSYFQDMKECVHCHTTLSNGKDFCDDVLVHIKVIRKDKTFFITETFTKDGKIHTKHSIWTKNETRLMQKYRFKTKNETYHKEYIVSCEESFKARLRAEKKLFGYNKEKVKRRVKEITIPRKKMIKPLMNLGGLLQ